MSPSQDEAAQTGQPDNSQAAENLPEAKQPAIGLPDDSVANDAAAKTQQEIEKIRADNARLAAEMQSLRDERTKAQAERDVFEKRFTDTQSALRDARNVQNQVGNDNPSFNDYLKQIDEDYVNDPQKAFRKVVTDLAYDRTLLRQEVQKVREEAIREARQKAYELVPEYAELKKDADNLAKSNPVFAGMTDEQRMEIAKLNKSNRNDNKRADARDAFSTAAAGSDRKPAGAPKFPGWVNDPEVVSDAQRAGFSSKKELLDWADPDKYKMMYRAMRNKQ